MGRVMKSSGIEWIGEIPLDWDKGKLKNIVKIKDGTHETPEYVDETEQSVPLITSKDISNGEIVFDNAKHISIVDYEQINKRSNVEMYDVIMPMIGTVGNPAIVKTQTKFSIKNVALFKCFTLNKARFLYYLLNADFILQQFEMFNNGGVQSFVSQDTLKNLIIIIPPLADQIIITNYLDRKCSLIDSTIEKQKAVIEKLKLYKQSIITEAVTKGLDSTIKMKPSGIIWVGDIPTRWKVIKLKYLGYLSANGVDKKTQAGEKLYKSVHYMDVYNNSLSEIKNSEDYLVISANDAKTNSCTLEKGDVLFTNSSETPADMGHSSVICENLHNTLFGYHLMRFRPKIKMHLQFEKYLFGSYYMRKWFEYRSIGMTRYGISYSDFAEALIILPTLVEQQAIADYLDAKCEDIDNVINSKQRLIEKLTDYKKSLIYECVTGKKEVV